MVRHMQKEEQDEACSRLVPPERFFKVLCDY